MYFQIIACKKVSKHGLWAVPVQNVKKCEQGQRSIALLTILIPEATNFWLLPRRATFHRTLLIEFARLLFFYFLFLEANKF